MENKIECPQCGHNFDVEEALRNKIEAQVAQDQQGKMKKTVEEAIAVERKKSEAEAQKKMQEQMQNWQKENEEKIQQFELLKEQALQAQKENKELKRKEVELLRKEQEMKDKEEELQLQAEKEFLKKQGEIEKKARMKEREVHELALAQMQKKLDDTTKLAEDLKRKSEQHSMQLQGETQELALEELLRNAYPFDKVDEVKKGARGADCLQTVINSRQQSCGSIVYESKNTKNFGGDWIEKLKQDQLHHKADIAVLVTEVLPSDMLRFGEKDGVWICTINEVKSLSLALRQILIKAQSVKIAQENQGEKSAMLYKYFTGTEFVQVVKNIVETYDGMKLQIDKEKKAMLKQWKEREKQVEKAQEGIISMFGSIKGIAGKELIDGGFLELESPEESLKENEK